MACFEYKDDSGEWQPFEVVAVSAGRRSYNLLFSVRGFVEFEYFDQRECRLNGTNCVQVLTHKANYSNQITALQIIVAI